MKKIKDQKVYVILAIIALCLLISTIGIELKLIALPIFASDAVAIVTVTAALVLTIMMYSIAFIKKRKTGSTQTYTKPAIHTINTQNKTPTIITPPTNNPKISIDINKYLESYKTQQKTQPTKQSNTQPINQPTKTPTTQTPTNKYLESYKTQQKTQPTKQTPTQPINQPTTQIPTQPTSQKFTQLTTEKTATVNQEAAIHKEKMTCPNCQKEYSIPLFSLDYSTSTPKLISLCPYCNQPLNSQPKNTEEEALWNKYLPNPDLARTN